VTVRPADGAHVPSSVPGRGPADLSAKLAAHRARTDAGPTVPAGGYPATVGDNPNAPADEQSSDDGGQVAQAPGTDRGAWSDATQFNSMGITGAIYS
jgi:hypothetical protein